MVCVVVVYEMDVFFWFGWVWCEFYVVDVG